MADLSLQAFVNYRNMKIQPSLTLCVALGIPKGSQERPFGRRPCELSALRVWLRAGEIQMGNKCPVALLHGFIHKYFLRVSRNNYTRRSSEL